MIKTVDDLIKLLEKHKGKNVLIRDRIKDSLSFIFELESFGETLVITKSVREYPSVK